ncbi:MAG: F0F1 ATP synthase subunit C [Holosporaceae bacterium]|jgi:F-type H+-transporting ATPase subunit c|nr:F0F1 ATP synthase subunit C [Holosporaceae bacterium]
MSTEAARMIGAAIAVLALYGVGVAMGNLFSNWIAAVARNPEAEDKVRFMGMLGFALTESIALFALLVALLILFK